MKKPSKKYYKKILAFVILTVLVIPTIIHIAFKISPSIDFMKAEWTAGDILSFYGGLIASVFTVIGVYLSIQYSRENYSEDVKNRVLPFVAITRLRAKSCWNPFIENQIIDSENNGDILNTYEEFTLEKVYFTISNGEIVARMSLTKDQQARIESGGYNWEDDGAGTFQLVGVDLLTLPLELENVGNGVANLFRIGLNSGNIDESKWRYLTPMPLKVGQKLYIHIYCDDGKISKGTYCLDLVYEDIHKNKYRQKYPLVIAEANNKIHLYFDMGGKQEKR